MATTDKYYPIVQTCERLSLSDIEIGAIGALQFFTISRQI